ncbi:hypothetical protein DVDV_0955 [Desulfovibrio sp. DV]|nr:hypothetical protein DVDV_0955 [Desulfovibrio sp. DV]
MGQGCPGQRQCAQCVPPEVSGRNGRWLHPPGYADRRALSAATVAAVVEKRGEAMKERGKRDGRERKEDASGGPGG